MKRLFKSKSKVILYSLGAGLIALSVIGLLQAGVITGSLSADRLFAYSGIGTPIKTLSPGVGIIGDSNSDEYRGDDNRGGTRRFRKNTLNWAEQLAQSRLVNFGTWSDSSRGEPRRKGFEYNWARTAATSGSLLTQNQHNAIANQIRQGKISLIVVHIGANDFAPYFANGYDPIYYGQLNQSQVDNKVSQIADNIDTALRTVNQAGNGRIGIIVTNIFDWNMHPAVMQQYPNAAGRQRVTNAINATNAKMKTVARRYGATYNDLNAYARQIFNGLNNNGQMVIGGRRIRVLSTGNHPRNGFLGDKIHAGTVLEGLFANKYIQVYNNAYGKKLGYVITPLSDKEILQNAGLRNQTNACLRLEKYSERLRCLQS